MAEFPESQEAKRLHLLRSVVWVLTAALILSVLLAACNWFGVVPDGVGGSQYNVFSNISNGLGQ